jgi:hypothetical protein
MNVKKVFARRGGVSTASTTPRTVTLQHLPINYSQVTKDIVTKIDSRRPKTGFLSLRPGNRDVTHGVERRRHQG